MEFLAMFPLNLVVFPAEKLNLHIFEQRYRELISDTALFGIPSVFNNQLNPIGTLVEIKEITKSYPTGESDIKTIGRKRFIIEKFHKNTAQKLYSSADISCLEDIQDGRISDAATIISLVQELFELMDIKKEFAQQATLLNVFDIGHYVGLRPEQEYQLLSMNQESHRQQFMIHHLKKIIPTVKEMKRLKDRVQMNGHFKNISGSL